MTWANSVQSKRKATTAFAPVSQASAHSRDRARLPLSTSRSVKLG